MNKKDYILWSCGICSMCLTLGLIVWLVMLKDKSMEEKVVKYSPLIAAEHTSDKVETINEGKIHKEEKMVTDIKVDTTVNTDIDTKINTEVNNEKTTINKPKEIADSTQKPIEEYIYTNEGNAITPNETTYIYDDQNRAIGQVIKGQEYLFENETDSYYEIQVENYRGYINKSNVKEILIEDDFATYRSTNDFIQIQANTKLYDANELYYVTGENRRYPIVKTDVSNYYILIANKLTKVEKGKAEKDKGIAVLMYHHLLKDEENKNYRTSTTISVGAFEQQMKYMYDNRFETITPHDLELYLNGQKNLSTKSVLITFDDGLKSNKLYAYPVMKKYIFKATNFIITSRTLDNPSEFNPDKLQFFSKGELEETTDVFNFEGHTHELHAVDNNKKSKVVNSTVEGLKADFALSKTILPNQKYFAYPFGQYNQTTIKALKESGYKLAFTTKTGKVQKGNHMYELNRIGITPSTSFSNFTHYLSNQF